MSAVGRSRCCLSFKPFWDCWFPILMGYLCVLVFVFIWSRFLETLSQVLDSYLPRMSGFELLKTVYHQCLLGYFPSAPLQQLLQGSTLEQLETTGQTGLFLPPAFIFSFSHPPSGCSCPFFFTCRSQVSP